VPAAFAAFQDYRLGAATFSAQMLAALRRMLAGETVEAGDSGLSAREWAEMMEVLQRKP
jgi:thymidylate synthase (FAD)